MQKKTLIFTFLLVFISIFVFSGCHKTGPSGNTADDGRVQYIRVTDALGRIVDVPANAKKFAAIGPGCLRLYCYIADTEKLVGVENFEVATEVNGKPYMQANLQLKAYPVIGFGGPGNTPDAESLIKADTDVIFTMYNYEMKEVDELQGKTGIPVVALSYGETELFDPALNHSLLLIGQITGNQDRAKEIIDYFDEIKKDLDNRTSQVPDDKKPTVYLGAQSMGGMYGIESTTGNYCLFNAVHAKNAVDMIGIHKYAVLDKEKILELDPDVIFLDAGGINIVKKNYDDNPGYYAQLSSFSGNNVHLLLPYNYYYTNLEIALANAYYIGKVLYPDQFSDIDPAGKFDEITTKMLGTALYKETAERYGQYGVVSFK
jgi:iron complex transport system substrate-binding protein